MVNLLLRFNHSLWFLDIASSEFISWTRLAGCTMIGSGQMIMMMMVNLLKFAFVDNFIIHMPKQCYFIEVWSLMNLGLCIWFSILNTSYYEQLLWRRYASASLDGPAHSTLKVRRCTLYSSVFFFPLLFFVNQALLYFFYKFKLIKRSD